MQRELAADWEAMRDQLIVCVNENKNKKLAREREKSVHKSRDQPSLVNQSRLGSHYPAAHNTTPAASSVITAATMLMVAAARALPIGPWS